MKRCLIFILMTVCIWGISGCGGQGASADTSNSAGHSVQDTSEQKKSWSEEDIISMFSKVKETDWEYIDCELMPDHASDRIGAVLFWDAQSETSNVAFLMRTDSINSAAYMKKCTISRILHILETVQ